MFVTIVIIYIDNTIKYAFIAQYRYEYSIFKLRLKKSHNNGYTLKHSTVVTL